MYYKVEMLEGEELVEKIEGTRLIQLGCGTNTRFHLLHDPTPYHLLPLSPLPYGYPPKHSTNETLDSFLHDVTNTQLFQRMSRTPEVWEPPVRRDSLLSAQHPIASPFRLSVSRHPITGELQRYSEECVEPPSTREECCEEVMTLLKLEDTTKLLTRPPGFKQGIEYFRREQEEETGAVGIQEMFSSVRVDFSWVDLQEAESEGGEAGQESAEVDTELEEVLREADEKLAPVLKQSEQLRASKKPRGQYEFTIVEDSQSEIRDFSDQLPHPAREFSFELDTFQKRAILLLEAHENVFVAAHTSAGKTVVAEYAIALAKKHHKKAIYTSPIKALSNQKFRDFKEAFTDVGIITGDVQLEKTAQCLIMTTEILRSYLYRTDDVIADVEWVVFDEVHYINDEERGVVWEEVLIMLPPEVRLVMLSATVPNSAEFAEWVGQTKRASIHVIKTVHRPVPLLHSIYAGNSGKTCGQMYTIAYSQARRVVERVEGYVQAAAVMKERVKKQVRPPDSQTQLKQDRNIWKSLIDSFNKDDKLPLIGFVLSRKKCDELADLMANSLCLTSSSERGYIHSFFSKSISRLTPCDRELPQVLKMQAILKRGVGVHHSGVLPILKEIVELLFQRGVVKVLFATETFAIGVNMPARTVAFDSVMKFDGQTRRNLHPGEYIQMAGRAGRRGKDDQGFVIIIAKQELPDFSDFHKMIFGEPLILSSKFRLRYSMILNTLSSHSLTTEDIIRKSFAECDTTKQESTLREDITVWERGLASLPPITDPLCSDIVAYYRLCAKRADLNRRVVRTELEKGVVGKVILPGRIMLVQVGLCRYTIGALMYVGLESPTSLNPNVTPKRSYTLSILEERGAVSEPCDTARVEPYRKQLPLLFPENVEGMGLLDTGGQHIVAITQHYVKKFDSAAAKRVVDDVRRRKQPRFSRDPPDNSAVMLFEELKRILVSYSIGQVPLVTAKDLHITSLDFADKTHELATVERNLDTFACANSPSFSEMFEIAREKVTKSDLLDQAKFLLSNESLLMIPEYRKRIQVLQNLEYVDGGMLPQMRGKIGCGFSVNELLFTELIVDNFFYEYTPEESVALLSCIIFRQKTEEANLNEKFARGRDGILEIARRIVECERECGLPVSTDDLLEQLNFGLTQVVYEWAMGKTFAEIMEITDVHEGIIVRCIQQLNETCLSIQKVVHTLMGTDELSEKMKKASDCIKRDIIFTGSLYIH